VSGLKPSYKPMAPPPGGREREPFRPISQLPNIVTLMALACGLTAVRFAIPGPGHTIRTGTILLLMLAAAVLDGLDGRLARVLDAQSEMGAQLDSLCDAIGFGVAPALITYLLVASDPPGPVLSNLAWLAAMVYAGAIVLRLGRFNVLQDTPAEYPFDNEFFVGIPAPAAAWLALVPVVCLQSFGEGWWSHPVTCSVWLMVVAALAFSRIPTFTFKHAHVSAGAIPVLLLAVVVVIALIFTFPYFTALGLVALYAAHIPFAVRQRRFLIAHPAAWEAPPGERREIKKASRRERRQAGHKRHRRRILGRNPRRRFRRTSRP
jgi:CDP-diacylglycerol--serine O-phosphatidyltransferase